MFISLSLLDIQTQTFVFSPFGGCQGDSGSVGGLPGPKDDDRDNVDKHQDDDDDDDDHSGVVETNAGESNGANCYLVLFANTAIRYVVAAMV